MDENKMADMLIETGKLMGLKEETLKKIEEFKNEKTSEEKLKEAFEKTTSLRERHYLILNTIKKVDWSFDDLDIVECDEELINVDVREAMWKNINLYTYDIENLFLKKFVFHIKNDNKIAYKVYFSSTDDGILLYVRNAIDEDVCGGVVTIHDDKFMPSSAITDLYYEVFKKNHIEEGLPTGRNNISDRVTMLFLLHILIVNEMINKNREVITETSKRIELPTKKKSKKKKHQPKKTKQIKYIKIDGKKIQRIREEYERTQREQYERHTDEWTRRGHYRRYKNGKTIWIEPTVAHAKEKVGEKVPKIYRLK